MTRSKPTESALAALHFLRVTTGYASSVRLARTNSSGSERAMSFTTGS